MLLFKSSPRHHRPTRPLVAAALLGGLMTAPQPATAQAVAPPFVLGVQTHFSQGWPPTGNALTADVLSPLQRDSLPWPMGEPTKGRYALDSSTAQTLKGACKAERRLILTQVPVHPLYDEGQWVSSDAGRTAFADYLVALKQAFGPCLVAIELGNEINGTRVMRFAPGTDTTAAYVRLAATVRAKLGGSPALLGGSTNMIGTGFLRPLFAAGLLTQVDGIAVHPYRTRGEGVDLELAKLRAAMDASGRRLPVWATEFGLATADQTLAAGELVKQATLLAANDVATASWYALVDQSGYPTMGLFSGSALKEQGRAFRFLQATVLSKGRPLRLDLGDPLLQAWRFGDDVTVIWGTPRSLVLGSGTRAYSPTGATLAAPTISEAPIVLIGKGFTAGASPVVGDTLFGWGTGAWRYFVRAKSGKDTALDWIDDTWSGYFGNAYSRPLRINTTTAAVAGTGSAPLRAVWRYTAPGAQSLDLRACFAKAAVGDGVDLTVLHNGRPVWQAVLADRQAPGPLPLDLARGDRVDLVAGPNQTAGGDAFTYRLTLFRRGQSAPVVCPDGA